MKNKDKFLREFNRRLEKIKNVFNVGNILSLEIDQDYINKYYQINKIAYYLFSSKFFVHMGISRNGVYSKEDLLEQAKIVESYIKKLKAKKVLELSVGRGGIPYT
ncbi:MAG: hypothetical protein KGZ85_02310 [Ignavibacterium sp.]|nr:hypothetical protein [Ignavibacterium sp.]